MAGDAARAGRLLILRPQPGADATAALARDLGLHPLVAPLFRIRPIVPPTVPHRGWDALLLTSANAARALGVWADPVRHLPAYAVGRATAAAARAAGLRVMATGEGDGPAIVARAAADGIGRLLHLAGREHRLLAHPAIAIERLVCYAAEAIPALPAPVCAAARDAVAVLHSPRAAELFAILMDRARIPRGGLAIAALSTAVATATGPGWRGVAVSPAIDDAALLAVAARLCEGLTDREDR